MGGQAVDGARPLAGKRILVTRPRDRAAALVSRLESLGAEVASVPAVRLAPPADWSDVDLRIGQLASYDWVVFTSVNGVEYLASRMDHLSARLPDLVRLAAVGPATARAVAAAWRPADRVPPVHRGAAIADALGDVAGRRVLLPQGDLARPDAATELERRGAITDPIVVYRSVPEADPDAFARARMMFHATPPDCVLLASPSAAEGLARAARSAGCADWLSQPALVCIGPTTADAVARMGLRPAAVADDHCEEGLIDALLEEMRHHGDL